MSSLIGILRVCSYLFIHTRSVKNRSHVVFFPLSLAHRIKHGFMCSESVGFLFVNYLFVLWLLFVLLLESGVLLSF